MADQEEMDHASSPQNTGEGDRHKARAAMRDNIADRSTPFLDFMDAVCIGGRYGNLLVMSVMFLVAFGTICSIGIARYSNWLFHGSSAGTAGSTGDQFDASDSSATIDPSDGRRKRRYRQRGSDTREPGLEAEEFRSPAPTAAPTNPPLSFSKWCPLCEGVLCNRRFIFVVGFGRTGATTVMNMLNMIPGIYVSGENGAILSHVQEFANELDDLARRPKSLATPAEITAGLMGPQGHAWMNMTRLQLNVQKLIWDLYAPPPEKSSHILVRGFKEIRWSLEEIQLIKRVCPCSRFVLSVRDDLSAWERSLSAALQVQLPVERLRDKQSRLREAVEGSGLPSRVVPLEQFSTDTFNQLAAWLGVNCGFNRVLHTNKNSGYSRDYGPPAHCLTDRAAKVFQEPFQADGSDTFARFSASAFAEWCPKCSGPLCKKKLLLIVGLGRTGTTTVMNMVNKIPGVYVSGENRQIVRHLMTLNDALNKWMEKEYTPAAEVSAGHMGPWGHAWMNLTGIHLDMQLLIWDMLMPPLRGGSKYIQVRGFKEIRWSDRDLAFIQFLFPCSRLVLCSRSDIDAWQKSISAMGSQLNMEQLSALADGLEAAVSNVVVPVHKISIGDSAGVKAMSRLAQWLGVDCSFNRVLHAGANGGFSHDSDPTAVTCSRR